MLCNAVWGTDMQGTAIEEGSRQVCNFSTSSGKTSFEATYQPQDHPWREHHLYYSSFSSFAILAFDAGFSSRWCLTDDIDSTLPLNGCQVQRTYRHDHQPQQELLCESKEGQKNERQEKGASLSPKYLSIPSVPTPA
jgi:hypothetical protein